MKLSAQLFELPERLNAWQKVLFAVILFGLATAIRAVILPPDGTFVFATFVPAVMLVFFACGLTIGLLSLVASMTVALAIFTPIDKIDFGHLLAGYALGLSAGAAIGVFFDLLRRNTAELRFTRALYQGIVDSQREWVFRLKPDGSIAFANPSAMTEFGLVPADIPGRDWRPMAHPDDLPASLKSLARLSPGNPSVEIESRVLNARGGVRWGHFHCQGMFDAAGNLIEIQSVARDVTERHELQKALQTLAGELADLYQNAPCAYYSLDAGGLIIKANARLLEWLGQSAEEVIGKQRLPDFFDEEGRAAFIQAFDRFKSVGHVTGFEPNLVSRDGTIRRVSISANAQFDRDRNFLQTRSIMVDVTDRVRAERELQRFNTELETRVAERTAELTRAHRELETFSYSVSHDLRAPLRAVNGLASIILEDHGEALPPECIRLLERIRDAGQRMGILVDVLLSLSRLELGHIQDQPLDTAPIVQDVFAELRFLFGATAPELVVHHLPPCRAQPALLRQVWHNLLSNAVKHSIHRPGARIEVGCDTGGAVPAYYVKDNGEGFDMRYAGKLFQLFERLQADGVRDGHGVGLAIVRRIVERHGGRVWADAVPGAGATFHFTLAPEPSAT
ncbi:MAG: hypothetical protein RLZZ200_1164 [Pseudomonadota bacterium]|jgi:PAS domain S-box-containing protein